MKRGIAGFVNFLIIDCIPQIYNFYKISVIPESMTYAARIIITQLSSLTASISTKYLTIKPPVRLYGATSTTGEY